MVSSLVVGLHTGDGSDRAMNSAALNGPAASRDEHAARACVAARLQRA